MAFVGFTCDPIPAVRFTDPLLPHLRVCPLQQVHHFSVIGYGSPIPGSSEGNGEVHSSIVVLSCSGGTGPEQGDVSHPEPVTGGMEVCRNRYVTSVPVTLHQRNGCSGHTRSTLKATVALWPECGPPDRPSPLLHREGELLLGKRQGMQGEGIDTSKP